MTAITLKGLAKRFGQSNYSLQPTDLTIADGEFLTLLGPSGCGKTTTLRMIAGLESPSEGEIWFGNQRVDVIAPGQRNIAMVFQNYALYPHLTVRGNLAYPLKKRRVPVHEHDGKIGLAAEMLRITELLDRKPRELSGGQQQRVALGRAMIRDPNVFLFDEPLSNLDAQLRTAMRAELMRLHKALGKTMVYVTHDQLEAMTMSDRIVILNGGKIQQVGTPADVYKRPANQFVASFVGTPAINFFDATVSGNTDAACLRTAWGTIQLKTTSLELGRKVVVGVRPENIVVGQGNIVAQVKLVENLGHEIQLVLRLGYDEFTVRAAPTATVSVGENVAIAIDSEAIHLFEPSSGNLIQWGH